MIGLDRRAFLAGALSSATAPAGAALAAAAGTSLVRFNVLRNGKPFGRYTVDFATKGEVMTVTTNVAMSARIASVTVFDYRHRCVETWRNGVFMEMSSYSIRDNQPDLEDVVRAERTIDGIRVSDKAGLQRLPASAHPLTHWNPATLKGPLFNPQTGALLRVTATPIGKSVVAVANGSRVTANHWLLRGETQIDEWYADSGAWFGLRGALPDRSVLEYRRV